MIRAAAFIFVMSFPLGARAGEPFVLEKDTGYRGIWYQIKSKDGIKYSGGLGTYPQQIRPMAVYSAEANKTFFVYGGRPKEKNELLHMVSYFDHVTKTVPRPRILLTKKTADAHDNPAIALDGDGHVWVFSNTHGPEKRSSIHRSAKPYEIDAFETVADKISLSYGQPWFVDGRGFMLIQNRYADGRAVAFQTSRDGRAWSDPGLLAQFKGHYQISGVSRDGKRLGVAFNYHPRGLDTRTNLYYVETSDFGDTWRTANGEALAVPLKDVTNAALVHDYEANGLLVYLKDIQFDAGGRPILVYLTSKHHEPRPGAGPHAWHTAHWTGDGWRIRDVATSDHNYDFGQLYAEANTWKLVAPLAPGPAPFMTGGEVEMWQSSDDGATWAKLKSLTHDSPRHHTFVRQPLNPHDDFYAFWADGDPSKASDSSLYFTDKQGSGVWRLPARMTGDVAKPQP
jgi:hypothetical protein